MKKSLILVLAVFLALSIFPAISAVQIDIKSNFSQDETLIAQISGNFMENIQEGNILLYQDHVRVSFIPYVKKIEDQFYVYGQLEGKSEGNYSLVLSGVSYSEFGETKDDDVSANFTVTNSQADFLVMPGFLKAESNGMDFLIGAQNFLDTTLTVTSFIKSSTDTEAGTGFFGSLFGGSTSSSSGKTETQISPGQTKSIPFSANNSYNKLIYFVLESDNTHYEIPVFIQSNTSQGDSGEILEFKPSQREISLATNSSTFIYLNLYNSLKENLTDVSLFASNQISPYVSVMNKTLALNSNSTAQIRVNVSSGLNDGIFEGNIVATSGNHTAEFILILNFSRAYTPSNTTNLFQTCSELNGDFCNENQTCGGQVKTAEDGPCCVGGCKAISSNSGRALGWALAVIIVLLVIGFFVWRYVKAKKPFNLLDFAKKK